MGNLLCANNKTPASAGVSFNRYRLGVGQDLKRIREDTTTDLTEVKSHGRTAAQNEVFLRLVRGVR